MSTSAERPAERTPVGFRLTPQRRAILRVLRASDRHPDAGWIYEQVRKELPNISLGTVYRNLAQLGEAGEVVELGLGRARRWDGNIAPHEHIVCRRCGVVEDVDILRGGRDLDAMAAKASGFVVQSRQLQFEGICPRCQRDGAPDPGIHSA